MTILNECENLSEISGAALDVLDRFGSGFDDLVYEISADLARERTQSAADKTVVIEVVDVQRAVKKIVQIVREQMKVSTPQMQKTLGALVDRLEQETQGQ